MCVSPNCLSKIKCASQHKMCLLTMWAGNNALWHPAWNCAKIQIISNLTRFVWPPTAPVFYLATFGRGFLISLSVNLIGMNALNWSYMSDVCDLNIKTDPLPSSLLLTYSHIWVWHTGITCGATAPENYVNANNFKCQKLIEILSESKNFRVPLDTEK